MLYSLYSMNLSTEEVCEVDTHDSSQFFKPSPMNELLSSELISVADDEILSFPNKPRGPRLPAPFYQASETCSPPLSMY